MLRILPQNEKLSHKTLNALLDSHVGGQSDYLSPEPNSTLSTHRRELLEGFDMYCIFQECNYHIHGEKSVLCFV